MINQSSNPQFEGNQNDICLLYVIYFSPRESRADCAMSASVLSFSPSESSHLYSQDDLMTDPIAGGRETGKMFSSLFPLT